MLLLKINVDFSMKNKGDTILGPGKSTIEVNA